MMRAYARVEQLSSRVSEASTTASGSVASLMLNLESVLTALLAWLVFKENADKRIVLGMVAIVAGGVVLSWSSGGAGSASLLGIAAIAVACLCWAIDNNLTRKVSASDSVFIASSKGFLAGLVNCAVALGMGPVFPCLRPLCWPWRLGCWGMA